MIDLVVGKTSDWISAGAGAAGALVAVIAAIISARGAKVARASAKIAERGVVAQTRPRLTSGGWLEATEPASGALEVHFTVCNVGSGPARLDCCRLLDAVEKPRENLEESFTGSEGSERGGREIAAGAEEEFRLTIRDSPWLEQVVRDRTKWALEIVYADQFGDHRTRSRSLVQPRADDPGWYVTSPVHREGDR